MEWFYQGCPSYSEGNHLSTWEKGELALETAEDKNYAPLSFQKQKSQKKLQSLDPVPGTSSLFWDPIDRGKTLQINICIIFSYSNYPALMP